MLFRFFILINLCLLLNSLVIAKDSIELFILDRNGDSLPIPQYESILENLKKGDVLKFSNGKKFTIGDQGVLGSGSYTLIVSLKEFPDKALRVPLKKSEYSRILLNEFNEGINILKAEGVPSVDIFEVLDSEYIVVNKLPKEHIILEDFLNNFINYSDEIKKEMKRSFIEFSKSAVFFEDIADFHSGQIAYIPSKQKWILFDWGAEHRLLEVVHKDTPHFLDNFFDNIYSKEANSWINDLMKKATKAIRQERQKLNFEFWRSTREQKCFKRILEKMK